ncbi:Uncharacterised protein [Vibrio cholerae]|nr:Uncharacterised protein [Vibrio cholerae]CSC65841.1 Uncharacterised protein [Vibrio cholerae]CSC76145.1 Uncharacterised protein [Vibrio cholerae]
MTLLLRGNFQLSFLQCLTKVEKLGRRPNTKLRQPCMANQFIRPAGFQHFSHCAGAVFGQ